MERVSDYIFKYLKDYGVDHIYGLPGGAAMYLFDSLRLSKIPYTACVHEFSAGMAAVAHAQYTGKLGVVLVTNGPGAINAINACAAAWMDSIPVLFISGQCRTNDMNDNLRSGGQQQVDIVPMVKSITKYADIMRGGDDLDMLNTAVKRAMNGRKGPVWIEVPVNVQSMEIEPPPGFYSKNPGVVRQDLYNDARNVAEALMQAKRPLVLVGWGAMDVNVQSLLHVMLNRYRIPFMTTWRAAEFANEEDDLYVGRPGNVGQRAPGILLQECDLLITIGARLDPELVAYDYPNFASSAKKIAIDIDSNELRKLPNTDRVCADAGTFLVVLWDLLIGDGVEQMFNNEWLDWKEHCAEVYRKYRREGESYEVCPGAVNTYKLIRTISDYATSDDVIVPGSAGPCMYKTLQAWEVKHGQRFIFSAGLQSMGSAIPMAMGAAIASGRRVISIVGDGGFLMTAHTLSTIRLLDLPIKFFVISNGGYAAIKGMQDYYFGGGYIATTPNSGLFVPNAVSNTYGVFATGADDRTNLDLLVRSILKTEGPYIVSVTSDIDEPVVPRVRSQRQPDGSLKSMGIGHMWPFLDEKAGANG